MEMTTHSIDWFEIPVSDFPRAKTFYGKIFDFDMPEMPMGPNLMGFLLFEMGVGIGGAIVKGEGYVPSTMGSLVYLNAGKDLSVVAARIEAAGGKMLWPKTQISPEHGYFALFLDSEGNRVGLHSPE